METTTINEQPKEIKRLRDLKLSAQDQFRFDPRIIKIEDGHNPRDYNIPKNRAHLDALKANIKENGTLVPLLVRFDSATKTAILVDGECRLRANLELISEGVEIDSVPVIGVTANNETERLVMALTANTGEPLTEWESGKAYRRLVNFGWTTEKIAKRLGLTNAFVARALELADAPQEVQAMLSQGTVTPALAIQEVRRNGANAVETLREKANAAKASGQTTAKRERRVNNNVTNANNMATLVTELFNGIDMAALESKEFKFTEVRTDVLIKLAKIAGVIKAA